ncbi:MAG: hypothetical protein ING08_08125 [Roseomonas sp.]|nr:hypothetical protein [Roseomonas sp.]
MTDIVERLQAAIHDPETGEPLDTEGQGGMSNATIADVEDAIDAIVTLRVLLNNVVVTNNGVGYRILIDGKHPPHTASLKDAKMFYGDKEFQFQQWCGWKAMEDARAALGGKDE